MAHGHRCPRCVGMLVLLAAILALFTGCATHTELGTGRVGFTAGWHGSPEMFSGG